MSHIVTYFAYFRKLWWWIVKASGLQGICLFRMSHILTYLSHILTHFLYECAFLCVLVRWCVCRDARICLDQDA